MSTPHPHSAADLSLAPILISIERKLAHMRDCEDLEYEFALELNDDDRWYHTPAERAERVVQIAIRDVPMHGWQAHPTPDLQGVSVEHGDYQVSVMLGSRLTGYIERGTPAEYFAGRLSASR